MTQLTPTPTAPPPSVAPPRALPKILFVDHTAALGGGEIALLNLIQHLDTTRHRPVVLLFSDGDLADKLRQSGVECHILPLDPAALHTRKDAIGVGSLLRLRMVTRVLGHVVRVARFIRKHDVALVHANSLKSDIIAGFAARLAGRPCIWHVRDRIESDYLPRPVVAAFRCLARIIPTFVIANSNATLQTLRIRRSRRTATIPSDVATNGRRRTVHDGTHPDPTPAPTPSPDAPSPLVGLVGRISPWKGQHIFLRAAAEVHKQIPAARFQIIGSAMFAEHDYEREVRALATELGLDGVVEFTGFRSDVPCLIADLDLLVHASTTGEPFGQVVIEGMAAGKAVVATRGGGVPEIVVDGETGLLVPMSDAPAMAAAILRLLSDAALRERMGRAGRQRVRDRFTLQHTAAAVQSIYAELLPSSKGQSLPPVTSKR